MSKKLYAHSKDDQPREDWQKLDVHLKNVAQTASVFSKDFCSSDWAWNAGRLHDLGKTADEFQAYLLRENGLDDKEYDGIGAGRINHSSAGAAFAMEVFGPQIGLTYAYLVSGHHAGLPDYYSSETGRAALPFRLDEGEKNLSNIRKEAESIGKKLRREVQLPPYVKPDHFHLWMRMLFSCIVDADFLDTEEFIAPDKTHTRGRYPDLSHLKTKFDAHMERLTSNAPDTQVNHKRKNILSSCRKAASKPQGLFSLSVPTGGGKTLSGMAFALDHAVLHKKNRIIYIIPYTSIIEQTAKILSDIFGASNIVEHHSNLDPEKETQRSRLASENWDAPVIITTNVQFFESLYAAKPGR